MEETNGTRRARASADRNIYAEGILNAGAGAIKMPPPAICFNINKLRSLIDLVPRNCKLQRTMADRDGWACRNRFRCVFISSGHLNIHSTVCVSDEEIKH